MKIWRTYFLNPNKSHNTNVELQAIESEDSFLVNNVYKITQSENK